MLMGKVAIIVEHEDGAVRPVSYEAASAGQAIAASLGSDSVAVTIGHNAKAAAESFASEIGIDAVAIETPGLHNYLCEAWLTLLPPLLVEIGAGTICMANTSQGSDFAPGLAAMLGASFIPAVDGISFDQGNPMFRRATHNGKLVAHVVPSSDRCVITIQPGAFEKQSRSEKIGRVAVRPAVAVPKASRLIGVESLREADIGLQAADVVVAAGRGMGSAENVELARRLAALFPKGVLAGSRPVCDAGRLPYGRQVGKTGQVVRPKVYIACAISGAPQHAFGMKDSGFIIAVNKDPYAPIFKLADAGVVEDAAEFLRAMLADSARADCS